MIRIISNLQSNDPFFNLALEEYLVRHSEPDSDIALFFYRNRPSVVLGKNQSIYAELNLPYCTEAGIEVCRRISGGGTVFHDPGNLNICIVRPFEGAHLNNYRHLLQPIADCLKQDYGLNCHINERNDLRLDEFKVSGSAQFTDRKRIISHCTLLIDSDLDRLRKAIRPEGYQFETRAMNSVRSPVVSLADRKAALRDIPLLVQRLTAAYERSEGSATVFHHLQAAARIRQIAREKMSSFEWVYGRSPDTILSFGETRWDIRKGLLTGVSGLSKSAFHTLAANCSLQMNATGIQSVREFLTRTQAS